VQEASYGTHQEREGTIGFTVAVVFGQIWLLVSPVYKPPWEPWPPIVPFMTAFAVPFMVNYYRPALIGLTGLVILWVWEGRRAGYLVALALAVIATGFAAFVTIFNAINQEWQGLLTAVAVATFPAIMALWYSLQGYRTHSGS
jgi:hypothetical protein